MTDHTEGQEPKPAKRGEAAWNAQRDAIAARNDQARKLGKQQRKAGERRDAERRRAADLLERAELSGRGSA